MTEFMIFYIMQIVLFLTATQEPNDEFCKGYDPLVKCLNRNFANVSFKLPQCILEQFNIKLIDACNF